jgi:hypothetical protein
MTIAEPRSAEQRKADTLTMLRTPGIDVWVATASANDDGSPTAHLVPLSLAWIDDEAVIAIPADSATARNLTASRQARLAVGPSRDVVMIDSVLDDVTAVEEAPAALIDGYCAQADWDPRRAGGGYVMVRLRPKRIQAWREANEIAGRTLMRRGMWTV